MARIIDAGARLAGVGEMLRHVWVIFSKLPLLRGGHGFIALEDGLADSLAKFRMGGHELVALGRGHRLELLQEFRAAARIGGSLRLGPGRDGAEHSEEGEEEKFFHWSDGIEDLAFWS